MNPFDIVTEFEQEMAEFTGAPYAVAVDSGTSALFLALTYCQQEMQGTLALANGPVTIEIPNHTFISVPTVAVQAGYKIKFFEENWRGWYWLKPLPIIDSALHLRRDMWRVLALFRKGYPHVRSDRNPLPGEEMYACLSFQYRKHIPIGRGGMILHNDPKFEEWVNKARFYGRSPCLLEDDPGPEFLGWRKYMTPDEAARGLCFLHTFPDSVPDLEIKYPSLRNIPAFQEHVVADD